MVIIMRAVLEIAGQDIEIESWPNLQRMALTGARVRCPLGCVGWSRGGLAEFGAVLAGSIFMDNFLITHG